MAGQHIRRFEVEEEPSDTAVRVPDDVAWETTGIVNIAYLGSPDADEPEWVLVDTGIAGFAHRILATVKERFGGTPPAAIVLTHGHADHVGNLRALMEAWPDVPVYAHPLEHPYLTGRAEYPPPDPTVGGGIMPRMAVMFRRGDDFGSDRIFALPADGRVPHAPGWEWIATPGHSPGHVSFYRESDGTLLAGDAFVTQKQESLVGVLTMKRVMHGPPTYYTPDWVSARASVQELAALHPRLAITGHGLPMANPQLDHELDALAREFDQRAVPRRGRYVGRPAITDEDGVVSLPPKPADPVPAIAAAASIAVLGVAAFLLANRTQQPPRVTTVHDWIERKWRSHV